MESYFLLRTWYLKEFFEGFLFVLDHTKQYSTIISGSALGPYGMPRSNLGLLHVKQMPYLLNYFSNPKRMVFMSNILEPMFLLI